ncbi:hypothetical protein RXV86_08055 [Alisedimentitalea sp. MJ-SS2]|uniref:hypothetical protein n=1 Tax=Aliisedimentitalea sp. MJ-SS2 TaxID=3049795 RepID=UPI00290D6105|nr:hypothetical protein [Alisedimentitalea sp. MJ-SS2]MDU8927335.1 hypothetical protein [Alisedimentitalea sp. MJ-SS2]
MLVKISKLFILSLFLVTSLSIRAGAQSADKVKLDVLSALSTPLPITIIGPLMTRDVIVTEEADGFRAVMEDTTLMGLFPFGEVSMKLEPLGADSYRISELQFPTALDFPGIGTVTFSGMVLEGTWSAASRSYSDLKWVTDDLKFAPGMGDQGNIEIGSLSFDVMKEPDDTDTESRFEIAAKAIRVQGMISENVSVGEVRALLAANGEKPVDLYSLIREVMLLGSMGGNGAQMQTLVSSLLGNSYDSVVLDLSASDLMSADARRPDESYFKAGGMTIRASLAGVEPRHWAGADIVVSVDQVDQREYLPDTNLTAQNALVRLSGGDLPVADMLATVMMLGDPPRGRPVTAESLLNGLMEFGKLEFASEGKAIRIEAFDRRWRENQEPEIVKAFDTGYDSWSLRMGVEGLNRNAGQFVFATEALGGMFVPGEDIAEEAHPHIKAWFPVGLRLQSQVGDLNEAYLKKLLTDVEFRNLNEPVEMILPLALYAAATVLDVVSGDDMYETELFRLTQKGHFKVYPSEFLNLVPYEGQADVRLSGLEALLAYFDETMRELRPRSDEAMALGAAKGALVVMRNIAEKADDGALTWQIKRADVTRNEIELNGVTLRYPDLMQYLPMLITLGL